MDEDARHTGVGFISADECALRSNSKCVIPLVARGMADQLGAESSLSTPLRPRFDSLRSETVETGLDFTFARSVTAGAGVERIYGAFRRNRFLENTVHLHSECGDQSSGFCRWQCELGGPDPLQTTLSPFLGRGSEVRPGTLLAAHRSPSISDQHRFKSSQGSPYRRHGSIRH